MPLNPMHLLKLELRADMYILTERADLLTKRDFINTVVSDKRFDAKEEIVIELAEKAFNWWNNLT
jgi:hypothetical protein